MYHLINIRLCDLSQQDIDDIFLQQNAQRPSIWDNKPNYRMTLAEREQFNYIEKSQKEGKLHKSIQNDILLEYVKFCDVYPRAVLDDLTRNSLLAQMVEASNRWVLDKSVSAVEFTCNATNNGPKVIEANDLRLQVVYDLYPSQNHAVTANRVIMNLSLF